MKRLLSLILCAALIISTLSGCSKNNSADIEETVYSSEAILQETPPVSETSENTANITPTIAPQSFTSLSDPELLTYIENDVYASLESQLASDDYIVENVSAIYISKEYLEEVSYNSQENIFFGYTLSELDKEFEGDRYLFTLGSDGTTVVEKLESLHDDTYDRVLKNLAIGAGIILVCVTVSVLTAGLGAPATVTAVFTTAAKAGTTAAIGGGVFSAATEAIVKGYETGDINEAFKAAALGGSDGFKWGAITGAFSGGITKAHRIHKIVSDTKSPSYRVSEKLAKELYGGSEQKSFLARKAVDSGTPHSTRPDLWRKHRGFWEAIEVKNYNLENPSCYSKLKNELHRQVTDRVANLPAGSKQRIVLDVRNHKFTPKFLESVIKDLQASLDDVYLKIPIDIMR